MAARAERLWCESRKMAEGVVVLDPLAGRREWTRPEFERERKGPSFWAHRP
jgi:hypothetical protein